MAISCWIQYLSGMGLHPTPLGQRRDPASPLGCHHGCITIWGFQQFAGRGLRYVAEYQIGFLSLKRLAGPDRLAIGRLSAVRATAGSAGARENSFAAANNTRLWCGPTGRERLSADWQEAFGHPLEFDQFVTRGFSRSNTPRLQEMYVLSPPASPKTAALAPAMPFSR